MDGKDKVKEATTLCLNIAQSRETKKYNNNNNNNNSQHDTKVEGTQRNDTCKTCTGASRHASSGSRALPISTTRDTQERQEERR